MNKNILFSATLATSSATETVLTITTHSTCNFKYQCQESELLNKLYRIYHYSAMWGSSTQTHFRPNTAGKSHLKQKRKNSNAPRAALGHFRWAPFFLYCQQIKSFRPTARTPAFIRFILFYVITFWQNWVFYVNR